MPRFAPRSQVPLPAAAGRGALPANAGAFPSAPTPGVDPVTTGGIGGRNVSFTVGGAPLQALRERYQRLQEAAPQLPSVAGMQSPWQGAAYLANTLVNSLQQNAAASAEQRGTQAMMDVFGHVDPTTGATSDQISQIAQYDPEFAIKLWEDRSKRLNQEHWVVDPEHPETQVNTVTGERKKSELGGAADVKLSDLAALRQDVIGDQSYKNLVAATPIYNSMVETAGRNTRASDLNMVYGLAKIMDPGSVVREGETVMVQNTASLPGWLVGQINALNGGASLQPDTRQAIMTEAYGRMKGYHDAYGQTAKTYTDIATRHGIDPRDIVPSFGELKPYGTPADATPPPPDATGKPPAPDANKPSTYTVGQHYTFPDGKGGQIGAIYTGEGDPNDVSDPKNWKADAPAPDRKQP